MLRLSSYIAITIVAALAAPACSREPSGSSEVGLVSPWSGTSASLAVGATSKTVLSGRTPEWTGDDVLTVFDADGAAVLFSNVSGAGASAVFSTASWTGKEPVYAAFSAGEPACNVYSKMLTVMVPAEQVVEDRNSFARQANPSIGIVSSTGSDYIVSTMKNVAALLEFTFIEDSEIASVKIEGCAGETIAGKVSAIATDATTRPLSSGVETAVILSPAGDAASADGCFLGGVKYYASVFPGTYSDGLRLTLTDVNGIARTKEIAKGAGITLTRGRFFGFGQEIDRIPTIEPPGEFIIALDFTDGWPFLETSSANGNYTYSYSMGDAGALGLRFSLVGQDAYDGETLSFSGTEGRILLPQVSGRYLNSIVVIHEADGHKAFRLCKAADDSHIATYVTHDWKNPIPVAKFSPHTADRCYLAVSEAVSVTRIYLRYSSSANGSDAVKLGYESNYSPWNAQSGQGDGSIYSYDPDLFFSGIVGRRDPNGTWPVDRVPDPYTFTQTVDDVVYTYEAVRPNNWANSRQRMWNWEAGLWSCDYGTPNALKLPRTAGKLVWVGLAVKNAYDTTKNRQVGILAKGAGDTDYVEAGSYAFLAISAQGSGDGTSMENSAAYKMWTLEDWDTPDRDYFISCLAGSTCFSQMVLVYL